MAIGLLEQAKSIGVHLMEVVEATAINSFGSKPPKADEQIVVLTTGQLSAIIKQAIQEASEPILQEIQGLKAIIDHQGEEIAVLKGRIKACGELQDRHGEKLDAILEKKPQPLQKDRGDILRALLAANGGKMLAKDARKKMHLSKARFSELLAVCNFVDTKPLHSDRRKLVIILKSELVPWN